MARSPVGACAHNVQVRDVDDRNAGRDHNSGNQNATDHHHSDRNHSDREATDDDGTALDTNVVEATTSDASQLFAILTLLAQGHTDQEIAKREYISYRTVRRRVKIIMDSYGLRTRQQLGAESVRRGWVSLP